MTEIDSPFKMLVLVILFFFSHSAFSEMETLNWRDLLPELDDELNLDDQTPWGERVRIDLNEKEVRIKFFPHPRRVVILYGEMIPPPKPVEGEKRVSRSALKEYSDSLHAILQDLFDEAQTIARS